MSGTPSSVASAPWPVARLAELVPHLLAFLLHGLLALIGLGLALGALAMLVLGTMLLIARP